MGEQERKNDLALKISKLQGGQLEAIEEYIQQLTELPDAQEAISEKYLTFWCGEQLFGICISQVMQIIQVPEVTPLPDVSHYMKGFICVRDEVIPIIDLRLRIGKPEIAYTTHTCVVIVSVQNGSFGIVVDSVNDVETIPDENIHLPLKQDKGAAYLKGIVTTGNPTLLLDMDELLESDEVESVLDASKYTMGKE